MTRRELLLQLLGLAACGTLPTPFAYAAATDSGSPSEGQPFSPERLRETARFRTSARRASAEYRYHLGGVLLEDVLTRAWERAGEMEKGQ